MARKAPAQIINICSTTSLPGPRDHLSLRYQQGGADDDAHAADGGRISGSGDRRNAIAPKHIVTEMNDALVNNPEFDAWSQSPHAVAGAGACRRRLSAPSSILASGGDWIAGLPGSSFQSTAA